MPFSFDNNKWGYVDSKSWNTSEEWDVVIPAKYDEAFSFYEGLARVKENNKFGFIDKSGTYVIPPIYDFADDFSGGLALVQVGSDWFLVNTTGQEQKGPLCNLKLELPDYVPYYECPKNSVTLLRIKLNWGK